MSETYCGKSCDDCSYKISDKCPGCMEGPGHHTFGACDLAKCCREKGHEKCDTCRFSYDCYLLKDKEYMPENMAKKTMVELDRRENLSKNVPLLALWINVLLWLNVPSFIGGLFTTQTGENINKELALLGVIITLTVEIVYGAALVKLAEVDSRYKLAGLLLLVSTGLSGFGFFMPASMEMPAVIMSLLATVLSTAASYYELSSHASVLRGIDNILSAKWIKLWNMTLIMFMLLFGGTFVSAAVASLGTLMVLASTIIALVVAVLKIKYTYDTAKIFKNYKV